jgi:hypothetical protein
MELKALDISKRYVPEWNGNKELPTAEQVVLNFIRIPGNSEKQKYKGFKFSSDGMVELVRNDSMLISAYLGKIENLKIGNDEIKDGKTLASHSHPALETLFTEIRDYLFPDNEFTLGE